jgi:hypothetical protein
MSVFSKTVLLVRRISLLFGIQQPKVVYRATIDFISKVTKSRSVSLWLCSPLLDLGRSFCLLILYTVGRTPWTGDQPVARPLPTHRTTQTQNKLTQTPMPWGGPETHDLSVPASEDSLDRVATVIGCHGLSVRKYVQCLCTEFYLLILMNPQMQSFYYATTVMYLINFNPLYKSLYVWLRMKHEHAFLESSGIKKISNLN